MRTAAFALLLPLAAVAADPASQRHPGIPQGVVTKHQLADSKVFPGTARDYWVYVPAQYQPTEPACLMVCQDGGGHLNEKGPVRATVVFDNLIAAGEMPVTIGLFVNPGVTNASRDDAQPRFNRSYEYDAFGSDYAAFLIDELIPRVAKDHPLSSDPDHRAIMGGSSGAIAAFNVAWQRPDAFRRVYSWIGTYVGLRGGDEFPTLIRKTEPKPLRVFLEDGSSDNNIYCGDWWMANQTMERALTFSGYEVEHSWGDGAHNPKHGGEILPEAMRWLWRDFPEPVTTHPERCKSRASELLVAGEDWETVSEGHGFTEGPAAAPDGSVFFTDIPNNRIHRIAADGTVSVFLENSRGTNGLAFGPDGRLYGCRTGTKEIVSWDTATKAEKIHATDLAGNDVVVAHDGTIYVTEPRKHAVWFIPPGGEKKLAADAFPSVNGLALTPDQSRLEVGDFSGRYVFSCTRLADGSLANIQPYHHLHIPPANVDVRGKADGMAVAKDGWLLVATAMGVQICDQPGRVNLIVPTPPGARHPSNVCFGGPDLKTLYATAGDKVFRRKTEMTGALAWQAPVKPPKPGL